MNTPTQGQPATYLHPAGPVHGTITKVSDSSVWFTFRHANGNDLELRFTQRKDGKWLQAGKGKYSGQLLWQATLTTQDADVLHRAGLTLPQWNALTDTERATLRWRLGVG